MPLPQYLPDITVISFSHQINRSNYLVQILVANIGRRSSKAIRPGVYVNAINPNPLSGQNVIQKQNIHNLPPLIPRTSCEIISTFRLSELRQKHVSRFEVKVDPKNLIKESNEVDNVVSFRML
jgi:subtilase family serine protease